MSQSDNATVRKLKRLYYAHFGQAIRLSKVACASLKRRGARRTIAKIRDYVYRHLLHKAPNYSEWISKHSYSQDELEGQRLQIFDTDILFSIITPLYNTPADYLKEMLESVIGQTYSKWELCLADASDDQHEHVGQICLEYASREKRIRYRKLQQNFGISGNTNACLEMATGEYVAFLDHDDILSPAALFKMMKAIIKDDVAPDVLYTDEAIFLSPNLKDIIWIHFKPDYAIDNLRAYNYLCHFTAYKRSLLDKTGRYRSEYDGSQDHDMMLRLAATTNDFVHIPEVLYFWRAHEKSTALDAGAKSEASVAGCKAVACSLEAAGLNAEVESRENMGTLYRIRYALADMPKVSIVIPNCDKIYYLSRCLESIFEKTTYGNFEVIVVENNSKEPETFAYYETAENKWPQVTVTYWPGSWNWSAINNFGIREASSGEYLLLLNNDTKVITPNWIEEMLMHAQRSDVGAVGAMLYYPDRKIQHAGVIVGRKNEKPFHAFNGSRMGDTGYANRLLFAQNLSAVTGACLMTRRDVWNLIGGLDESFPIGLNDIDFCLRIRKEGYLVVWTPYAELIHYESRSRGYEDTPEKIARLDGEYLRFWNRWAQDYADGDPYYNPNLSYQHPDFRPNCNKPTSEASSSQYRNNHHDMSKPLL